MEVGGGCLSFVSSPTCYSQTPEQGCDQRPRQIPGLSLLLHSASELQVHYRTEKIAPTHTLLRYYREVRAPYSHGKVMNSFSPDRDTTRSWHTPVFSFLYHSAEECCNLVLT